MKTFRIEDLKVKINEMINDAIRDTESEIESHRHLAKMSNSLGQKIAFYREEIKLQKEQNKLNRLAHEIDWKFHDYILDILDKGA